jgi:hypothetical protein
MRPPRCHRLLLPLSLAVLTGCQDSERQLRKAHQQLESWNATARLADELAQRGALPQAYRRQLGEAVAEGRDQAHQAITSPGQ